MLSIILLFSFIFDFTLLHLKPENSYFAHHNFSDLGMKPSLHIQGRTTSSMLMVFLAYTKISKYYLYATILLSFEKWMLDRGYSWLHIGASLRINISDTHVIFKFQNMNLNDVYL